MCLFIFGECFEIAISIVCILQKPNSSIGNININSSVHNTQRFAEVTTISAAEPFNMPFMLAILQKNSIIYFNFMVKQTI